MPISYKKFKEMVEAAGCAIVEVTQHNSKIVDENGLFVSGFARSHRKGAKRDEIDDCYVRNFQKSVKAMKAREV